MSKSSDCRIPDFLDESGIASLFGRLTDRRLGTRAFNDYDLYLVQHDVWPLLLEGNASILVFFILQYAAAAAGRIKNKTLSPEIHRSR